MGYKMAYLLTGASGLLWLIFWFAFYTTPAESKKLSVEEYNHIHSDDTAIPTGTVENVAVPPKTSWFKLLKYPQTWAFFIGKFLTDGIWWFLLFWLPDYLKKQFGLTGEEVMLPTFIVYGVAILGSTFGGSLPLFLINKGMPVYKARMTAMFIIALFPLLLLFTQYFGNKAHFGDHAIILAVGIICIGAAAHQAWSCNIFTTVSDMFPKKAVGSVTGIGGMAGGLGGVLVQLLAGRLTDHYKATPQIAYGIMFTICALAYIIAWSVIRILTSRSKQIVL
jgi:ACS family hexuronate transporter-like MFS transporter